MPSPRPRILLGVTGSIAAVKAPELVRLLSDKGWDIQCVLTKEAEKFVSALALSTFSGKPALVDMIGPDAFKLPHITFSEQADLMLIAPASATMIARCAHGLAEDLVSLCYITVETPVLMAPAMHPSMWEHPATHDNVKVLKSRGVHFVGPYVGLLADKTRGDGRMSEPVEIVKAVEKILSSKK